MYFIVVFLRRLTFMIKDLVVHAITRITTVFNISVAVFMVLWFLQRYGQAVIAGFTIATRIEGLVVLPGYAVAAALMAIMCQCLGAKQYSRLILVLLSCQLVVMVVGVISMVGVFVF